MQSATPISSWPRLKRVRRQRQTDKIEETGKQEKQGLDESASGRLSSRSRSCDLRALFYFSASSPAPASGSTRGASSRGGIAAMSGLSASPHDPSIADSSSPSSEDSPQSDSHSFASHSPAAHGEEPVASSSRVPRPVRTPSRYDWTKHKATIKRLYMDEDKTLREMLDIMARDYNFVAT